MNEAARSLNIRLTGIQKSISSNIKAKGFYFRTEKVDRIIVEKNKKRTGKIYQYDLSGNYIGEFNSAFEVARILGNDCYKRIPHCLKQGYKICGDYQ